MNGNGVAITGDRPLGSARMARWAGTTFGLLAMSGMPTVVALGSFAIAVYVHRVLPRYTAHLAIAAAAIRPLLLAAFIVKTGPLSLEGFSITAMPAFLFAWILATALAMPRHAR